MKTLTLGRTAIALTAVCAITAFNRPAVNDQKAPFADKYWILESSSITPAVDLNMDGKPDTDLRVMLEDCMKDDAEMFKTGGTLMKHNGKVKCDGDEDTEEENGTWEYNAATKQLTVHHQDTEKAQTVTVKETSAAKLVVSYVHKTNKGNHTITATYKAK